MISLEPYQERGRDALISCRAGIVKSPAGSGKTIIAASALDRWTPARSRLARRKMRVAWIAHTTDQCDQAESAINAFPRIHENADVTIACYASSMRLAPFDIAVLDECHHIAADEYRKMLDAFQGWRWGFSATPNREDERKHDVFDLIGPIVCIIEREEVAATGRLAQARVTIHQPNNFGECEEAAQERADHLFNKWKFGARDAAILLARQSIGKLMKHRQPDDQETLLGIMEEAKKGLEDSAQSIFSKYPKGHSLRDRLWLLLKAFAEEELLDRAKWIAAQDIGIFKNERRSDLVVKLALQSSGDTTLIIIGKIEHGHELAARIPGAMVVHSGMTKKASGMTRKAALAAFKAGQIQTVIATSLADEGLDVPRANVLILAAAGRSAAKAEQRTGRVLRSFQDKTHGVIHDFMDVQHRYLLAQSKRRISIYRQLGYEVTFSNERKGGLL